jgi:hypothetical protein
MAMSLYDVRGMATLAGKNSKVSTILSAFVFLTVHQKRESSLWCLSLRWMNCSSFWEG